MGPYAAGERTVVASVTDPENLRSIAAVVGSTEFDLIFMIPPSAFTSDDADRELAAFAAFVESSQVNRVLLVSSTGVYADCDESEVDINSPTPAKTRRV